jgi:hypothetical protein
MYKKCKLIMLPSYKPILLFQVFLFPLARKLTSLG